MVSQVMTEAYTKGKSCPFKNACPTLKECGVCEVEEGQECDPHEKEFKSIGDCMLAIAENCTGVAVVDMSPDEEIQKNACISCATVQALPISH